MINPLICAAVGGGAAYGTHWLLSSLRGEGSITTVVSVAVAALAYVISMGFTRTLTKNDVNMLTKGQKIEKLLEKIGFDKKDLKNKEKLEELWQIY